MVYSYLDGEEEFAAAQAAKKCAVDAGSKLR